MNNNHLIVRKLIAATGLSILSLALEIDASEKSIYKWMNGTSLPDCKHLLALIRLVDAQRNRV